MATRAPVRELVVARTLVPALAPVLVPGGGGEHTWQNQSPSGIVCSGGARQSWWKERPQPGLSQSRMSLPAKTWLGVGAGVGLGLGGGVG